MQASDQVQDAEAEGQTMSKSSLEELPKHPHPEMRLGDWAKMYMGSKEAVLSGNTISLPIADTVVI